MYIYPQPEPEKKCWGLRIRCHNRHTQQKKNDTFFLIIIYRVFCSFLFLDFTGLKKNRFSQWKIIDSSRVKISLCKLACKYSWIFPTFPDGSVSRNMGWLFLLLFLSLLSKDYFHFSSSFRVFFTNDSIGRLFIWKTNFVDKSSKRRGQEDGAWISNSRHGFLYTCAIHHQYSFRYLTLVFKKLLVSGMRCSLVSGRFISFVKTGEKGKTQVIKRKRFFLKATKAFDEQCVQTGINLMNKLRENPL